MEISRIKKQTKHIAKKVLGCTLWPLRDAWYKMVYSLFYEDMNAQLLLSIKNIYKGRRAFLICNGPSLNAKDLDRIADNGELSIASNRIYKIFDDTQWRPDLYAVLNDVSSGMKNEMSEIPAKFKFYKKESFRCTKQVSGTKIWVTANYHDGFSADLSEKCHVISTVTFSMLQILYYVGIREVYIIGCDNSYEKEVTKDGKIVSNQTQTSSHFYETKDESGKTGDINQMNHAYQLAKEFADKHDFHIYNATRGGHLEVFERVDFDTLFDAN